MQLLIKESSSGNMSATATQNTASESENNAETREREGTKDSQQSAAQNTSKGVVRSREFRSTQQNNRGTNERIESLPVEWKLAKSCTSIDSAEKHVVCPGQTKSASEKNLSNVQVGQWQHEAIATCKLDKKAAERL